MTDPREYRRALHRIPELGFDLPETTAFVQRVLAPLPCTVTSPAPGAIAAFFDAGRAETFAFRADMDALPICEKSAAVYTSRHAGQMHACGHDGHTAMLLSFAEYLAEHPEALQKNALLLFEPAEETTGGAKAICDCGLFERYAVAAVFGTHLWPGLAAGKIATRAGGVMACSCEANVIFTGKSSHIAKAAQGADALEAASRFLCAVYDAVDQMPQGEKRLLKFGQLSAGTVRNALAERATLAGSLRAMSAAGKDALQREVCLAAEAAARRTGCTVQASFSEGYPAVENDPALTERVLAALGARYDIEDAEPALTAEDFSFYGQKAPAVFFRLGLGDVPPLHAADFDFDDSVLSVMPGFYAALLGI